MQQQIQVQYYLKWTNKKKKQINIRHSTLAQIKAAKQKGQQIKEKFFFNVSQKAVAQADGKSEANILFNAG